MARGWESKDVENQQDLREERARNEQKAVKSAEDQAREREIDDLNLRRRRVLKDLRQTGNQRYRLMLEETLRFLDSEIIRVEGSKPQSPEESPQS